MSTKFVELFGYESASFESFIDLVYEDNKTFSRYYLRKENVNTIELNNLIHLMTIKFGFIIDKELKDRLELIDSKYPNQDNILDWAK